MDQRKNHLIIPPFFVGVRFYLGQTGAFIKIHHFKPGGEEILHFTRIIQLVVDRKLEVFSKYFYYGKNIVKAFFFRLT